MMNPQTLLKPAPRVPVVHHADETKLIDLAMGPHRVRISADDADGAYEAIELEILPGRGPPLHYHPASDEAFVVLEGTLTMRIGDRVLDVHAGGSALVPANTLHAWTNRGDKPMRFLQITTPGGSMEAMFDAFAARPLLGLEEMAQLAELHGTVVVGPPL